MFRTFVNQSLVGTIVGPSLVHVGTIFGRYWVNFKTSFGNFTPMLGPLREYVVASSGTCFKQFHDHVGTTVGPFWNMF